MAMQQNGETSMGPCLYPPCTDPGQNQENQLCELHSAMLDFVVFALGRIRLGTRARSAVQILAFVDAQIERDSGPRLRDIHGRPLQGGGS